MAHAARQNVIVSHGGRHGANGRTHRKGHSVPARDVALIPDALLGAQTDQRQQPKPDRTPGQEKLAKERRAKAKAKADAKAAEKAAKRKAKAEADAKAQAQQEEQAQAARAAETTELAAESEAWTPATKRELILAKKADVEALAERLGIHVDPEEKGRTSLMRDLIATNLNL